MKKILLIGTVILIQISAIAQISYGGYPQSFVHSDIKPVEEIETKKMPSFDLNKLQEEDKKTDLRKDIPFRFGYAFDVNYTLEDGTYETLENGNIIWRLKIKSEEAQTINLKFSDFHLAKGNQLFIYSSNKNHVLGAFTEKNNKENGKFATGLIKGEEIILELNIPNEADNKSNFILSKVIHGYRSLKSDKSFGSSGSCNNNVVCPEGDNWRDDIRASAMVLLANNTRWCSGSMINNQREDKTPYFLTAEHCIVDFFGNLEDVSDWVYMFNYESPDCSGLTDGPTTQTIVGSQIVSHFDESDFALLLLDTIPPLNYNVYYSGWYAKDTIADSVVGIHHPDGDIKKISFDYDSIEHSGYYSAGNDHWKVVDGDDGTTEQGSSGSPLFNKNHKIIGQLHGGDAKCINDLEDYYGKLSHSWNTGGTPQERLKDWLDPDSIGIEDMDGRDFNIPTDSIDVALKELVIPSDICGDSFAPVFKIQSFGADTLFKTTIFYELDNVLDSLIWEDTLVFGESQSIDLPTLTLTSGNHIFKAYSSNPNDSIDEQNYNDTILKSFSSVNGIPSSLNIQTDFFGYQNRLIYKEDGGGIIYFRQSFSSSDDIRMKFCLQDGCYELILSDSGNDGVGIYSGSDSGFFELNVNNQNILFARKFTDSATAKFCINNGNIEKIETYISNVNEPNTLPLIKIFPNPTSGEFTISSEFNIQNIKVFNMLGKEILEKNISSKRANINISNFEKGIYFIELKNKKGINRQKIILSK